MSTAENSPSQSERPEDRRRFHRIHLDTPLEAHLGAVPVHLVDLSLNGARVISDARFTPGSDTELVFDWNDRAVQVACQVVRCTLYSFAKAPGEKSLYQTGLVIKETIGDADQVIRELIASYVIRALEEQKANARGIPPLGPYAFVIGKGDRYRRCELVDGKWRRTETTRSEQPPNGFTISADVAPYYVDLLCQTYQLTDEEGKRLTQTLAQLSINKAEGIPTRRYLP
ncbi:MAG TPA: PilZ domain-containing protein [Thermoanaerobaculia bacterium]|nr:PilZ domain-containing protein [Thermoanaerobaculia bacterium]